MMYYFDDCILFTKIYLETANLGYFLQMLFIEFLFPLPLDAISQFFHALAFHVQVFLSTFFIILV